MKRRDIIKQIAVGSFTLLVLPLPLTSCEKEEVNNSNNNNNTGTGNNPLKIDLTEAANASLAIAGGFLVKGKIIVVNTGGGEYIALSSVCTHESCTISYNASTDNFPCPCHGSVFARNGSVLNGPAAIPLKVYKVTKSGDILTIE